MLIEEIKIGDLVAQEMRSGQTTMEPVLGLASVFSEACKSPLLPRITIFISYETSKLIVRGLTHRR